LVGGFCCSFPPFLFTFLLVRFCHFGFPKTPSPGID
jgi:hypothetical protein